jgi:hypothetical protein
MLDPGPGRPDALVRRPRRYLSRRSLLVLPGLATLAGAGLAGGCSEADQINNRVFGAVRKDPLYLWRPEWVTSVADSETKLGGIYPEAAAAFHHYLDADDLPSTALNDALILAAASGWRVSTNGIGYDKPIANSNDKLWVTIHANPEIKALVMEFIGQYA